MCGNSTPLLGFLCSETELSFVEDAAAKQTTPCQRSGCFIARTQASYCQDGGVSIARTKAVYCQDQGFLLPGQKFCIARTKVFYCQATAFLVPENFLLPEPPMWAKENHFFVGLASVKLPTKKWP